MSALTLAGQPAKGSTCLRSSGGLERVSKQDPAAGSRGGKAATVRNGRNETREEGARKTSLRHSALLIRKANPKPVICGQRVCVSALSSETRRHGKRIPEPKQCVWVQLKLATTSGNIILGGQVIMCLKQQREKTERGERNTTGGTKQ